MFILINKPRTWWRRGNCIWKSGDWWLVAKSGTLWVENHNANMDPIPIVHLEGSISKMTTKKEILEHRGGYKVHTKLYQKQQGDKYSWHLEFTKKK